jgi:hypothetical protein
MTRDFGFYEYAGIIIPGVVALLGFLWLVPEGRAYLSGQGVSLGELGVLVIAAYAAGQLVQGVGNWIEWLWWKVWGGLPSRRVLGGQLVSAEQHKRILEALQKDGTLKGEVSALARPEWLAIVREVYSVVRAAGKAERVDTFLGNYGLLRGLAAAFLVLVIAAAALGKGAYPVGALIVLLLVALQRMDRFGRHYALELFIQYLLVTRHADKPAG